MNNLPFNEIWPLADAARLGLMTTLQGMGIVFLVLALLALITLIMSAIVKGLILKPAKKEAPAVAAVESPVAEKAEEKHEMIVDGVENEETVAVIMAIVAFNSGTPVENLKFNSIKAID